MIKWLTLFFILLSLPATATPVVADLSNYDIMMDSSYNGTRMFVFGARADNGDIVVVIRGPKKNYIVRKKEEIGGIWVNKSRVRFHDIPSYYALATSRPLNEIEDKRLFDTLGIGNLNLFEHTSINDSYSNFINAFFAHQQSLKLYFPEPAALSFMGETLFKTVIAFPDNIPPGAYVAEIYLLSDSQVVGMQAIPITVKKVGLDGFLNGYAHQHPFLYGITAVLMALSAGWFAGRLFERY